MTKRMLVDATHAEEVRVAVVQDQRLIDLDIETASREQIKGNVYLARVTRVEPSLQAAFVEFHSGRQGFLSINDIHNKYYPPEEPEREGKNNHTENSRVTQETVAVPVEEDDLSDELPPSDELRPRTRRRHLPIQRLLSRGQTLLVQVVKEARSNKGASLTTHISLAGRYTVLLPENSGGGGISRKITDVVERKHLKEVLASMEIPSQVSLIIRTAGLGRTKREIARDMSYLLRLWKMIEDKARHLKPPALIHEEGDLIIRAIRDLYTTDMEEILIDGQEGYRIGKDFMRLLMPRYVKVVQPYKESLPLFARYQIENQIESMHERKVPLRAGGYLVIDPTEALVTIDINSGRSTREKDVESTAFKTNLQAAEEIGRQLRLRDLGGLIVIDFIDMDDKKHILEVEKQLKDAFKLDRAKIQIGKISSFGLLELSRQRMKPTFNETSRLECPRCKGLGTIRSIESASIHLFRQLEEEVAKGRYSRLTYTTSQEMANYLLNNKRDQIRDMETMHDTVILIYGDPSLQTPEFHKNRVERTQEEMEAREAIQSRRAAVVEEPEEADDSPDDLDDLDLDDDTDEEALAERGQEREQSSTRHSPERSKSPEGGPTKADPSASRTEPDTAEKSRRRRRRRKKAGGGTVPVADSPELLETGEVPAGSAATSAPSAGVVPAAVTPGRRRAATTRSADARAEAVTAAVTHAAPVAEGQVVAAPLPTDAAGSVTGTAVAIPHVPGLYFLGSLAPGATPESESASLTTTGTGTAVSAQEEDDAAGASTATRSRRRRRRRRSGQSRTAQVVDGVLQAAETAEMEESAESTGMEESTAAAEMAETAETGEDAAMTESSVVEADGPPPALLGSGHDETLPVPAEVPGQAEAGPPPEPPAPTESVAPVPESAVADPEPATPPVRVRRTRQRTRQASTVVPVPATVMTPDMTPDSVTELPVMQAVVQMPEETGTVTVASTAVDLPDGESTAVPVKARATRTRSVRRKAPDEATADMPVPATAPEKEKKTRVYRKRTTKDPVDAGASTDAESSPPVERGGTSL
ncbi:MAG: Rne/Rng family ribonuclease [Magnetococcus sp. DMHC-8]